VRFDPGLQTYSPNRWCVYGVTLPSAQNSPIQYRVYTDYIHLVISLKTGMEIALG